MNSVMNHLPVTTGQYTSRRVSTKEAFFRPTPRLDGIQPLLLRYTEETSKRIAFT